MEDPRRGDLERVWNLTVALQATFRRPGFHACVKPV